MQYTVTLTTDGRPTKSIIPEIYWLTYLAALKTTP
jgi:hypothetical protein